MEAYGCAFRGAYGDWRWALGKRMTDGNQLASTEWKARGVTCAQLSKRRNHIALRVIVELCRVATYGCSNARRRTWCAISRRDRK